MPVHAVSEHDTSAPIAAQQKQRSAEHWSMLQDNRPETATQQKHQQHADQSPQIQQAAQWQQMANAQEPIQRKVGFEFEVGGVGTTRRQNNADVAHTKGAILSREFGYNVTADINANASQLEFVTDQFDETDDRDLDELEFIAQLIEDDLRRIVANRDGQGRTLASNGVLHGKNTDSFWPAANNHLNLAGQLQMTGGLDIYALAGVLSGRAMPDRDNTKAPGLAYQDYALHYQPSSFGNPKQPIYAAATGAVNGFVTELGPNTIGIPGKVRGALAAVLALMAEVPLNMYGELQNVQNQGQFLARTDYSKIMKLICDDSGLHLNPNSFALALRSTINQIAQNPRSLDDDVFPANYNANGQQLTGVTIGQWARSVVPTPGKLWGRWQGTDLITKENFPGTQAQKDELRPFGGFGSKTDPGNKVILEWRNFQMMYADQLPFVLRGLAEYLRSANE